MDRRHDCGRALRRRRRGILDRILPPIGPDVLKSGILVKMTEIGVGHYPDASKAVLLQDPI